MKKFYFVLIAFTFTALGFGQIVTFEFSGLAGNEASAVSNFNNSNLGTSTITRGAGLTASANGGRFNATNWALTSIANAVSGNNYMQFTISPNASYQFTVSSITISLQRSGTGPSAIALRNSLDSYATNLDTQKTINDVTSTQSFTFTFTQAASSVPVTYRMYMYAEATGGSGGPGDFTGDDIIVNGSVASSGCTPPGTQATAYNTTGITTTTGTPNWTRGNGDNVLVVMRQGGAVNADPTSGTSYTADAVFGSGQEIGTGNFVVYNGSGTSENVTALTQNTNYHVAVYEYATTGTCYNTTELTGNFNTLCTAVSSLPFTEDFEGGGVPSACWTTFRGANNLGTDEDWKISASGEGYPAAGFAARVNPEAVSNTEDWLVTPALDLSLTSSNQLTFYAKDLFGTDEGSSYTVRVSTTSQTSIASFSTTVATYTEAQLGNSYNQKVVDLSAFDGEPIVYIAFVLEQSNGDVWFLDDVAVTGSCVSPTTQATGYNTTSINAAAGSATLNWTRGNGDNVLVVVKAGGAVDTDPTSGVSYADDTNVGDGDELGTGNFVVYDGSASTVNITNLMPNTTYHVAIYEYNNAATCYRLTELTGNFYVPCLAESLPFTEGFEGGTIPACWAVFDNGLGTVKSWTVDGVLPNGGTQSAHLEFEGSASGTSEDWLVTPAIDLTSVSNGELTFFTQDGEIFDNGSTYTVRVSILSQTTPGDFTIVQTYNETQLGSTYNKKTIDLTAYAGETVYIAFVMEQDLSTGGDDWYLDDVEIKVPVVLGWQIGVENQVYTIDFDTTVANVNNGTYAGTGFTPSPIAGRLDSGAWATTGMSDGDSNFGDTDTTGDFAKGSSAGGETSGGFWSFDVGSSNFTFGVQPGGSDFTPGDVILRAQNQTGQTVTTIDFQYTVYVNNNEARGNSFNFAYSDDNSTYVDVTSLDITSTAAADAFGFVPITRNITINSLSIADGDFVYMRWTSDDVSGSGSRDEFGLDDISVVFNPLVTSNESDIVENGFDEPDNIDYLTYTATSGLTTGNAVKIGEFNLQDGGNTMTDADTLSTILTDLEFSVANFSNLAALAIFDDTNTNVSEVTSVTATTAFNGLNIEADDNDFKVFSVYATFLTTVTDNEQIQLTISSATSSLIGSGFADADAGAAATSVAGDDNRIEVTATELNFGQQPSDVNVNQAMAPAVTVTSSDVNGNVDVDFVGSITMTSTGTFTGFATTSASISAGIATFGNLVFISSGTYTLTATGSITSTPPSTSFIVSPAPKSFWYEPFTNNLQYTVTAGGEGNDGNSDYFQITDGTNIDKTYTGNIGNFFAAQDIDDGGWAGSATPSQLTWTGINISRYRSIKFSGKFASVGGGIDAADFILVEYRIDGGSWENLIAFRNNTGGSNENFYEDTNFDGTGDGAQLTGAFQNFTKSISTATLDGIMDLRITIDLNSGDEEIALEDFKLGGIGTVFHGNAETGFGGVVGTSTLEVYAGSGTNVDFIYNRGSSDFNDYMVIYIDSKAGGIATTANLTDTGDDGRKAISGYDGGNRSTITFPPGFRPDYAISMNNGFAGLFEIVESGSHTFVQSANLSPTGNATAGSYDFNITFANIVATPGLESFKFLATYLNGSNAFRSNESVGRNTAGTSNPGQNPITFETYFQVTGALQGGKAPTQAAGVWTADGSWLNGNPPLSTDEITINNDINQNTDVLLGGIVVNADLAVLPSYTLTTSGGITGTGTLDVSGKLSIIEGGYTDISPTYNSGSTLEYKNITSVYNRYNEWNLGAAPSNVIIDNADLDMTNPSINPNATEDFNVGNDLSIINGGSLTIAPVKSVTVGNALSNTNGTVTVNSNSQRYASLIANSVSGAGTFEYNRHVNTPAVAGSGGNDLVSPPFTGQLFTDFATNNGNIRANPGNADQKLFGPFSKTTGTYLLWDTTVNTTETLDAGVGYRTASTDGLTFGFRGAMNVGNVDAAISIGGPQFDIWNLIGNPYSSYIKLSDFLTANTAKFDDTNGGVYGYNGASGGFEIWNDAYALLNPTAVMTPGQGFLVASKLASDNVNFTAGMRSTGATDDFIAGRTEPIGYLRINTNISTIDYTTDFYFTDYASRGLDPGFDSGIFGAGAGATAVYSHLVEDNTGRDMGIQSIAYTDLNSDVSIPLGINVSQGQQVTVSMTNAQLPDGIDVYLEDNLTNVFTLLNTNDYIFTPNSNLTNTGRFFLRFTDQTLSNGTSDLDRLQIYALDQTLFINGLLNASTTVALYDIQGRKVLTTGLASGSTNNTVDVSSVSTGVYVVKLTNATQQKTQRVIIK